MIILPWPDKRLSPNARVHHMERGRVGKSAKTAAYYLARIAMAQGHVKVPEDRPLPVLIEFCPPDSRVRDADNMLSSGKHALDGIAEAIGVDDAHWRLTITKLDPVKGGEVRVFIGGAR